MSVIIFDSEDGNGKTQMARELSRIMGIPYFKNRGEWRHFREAPTAFREVTRWAIPFFLEYLEQTGASVIMDRGYPSEWVYSRYFDRPNDPDVLRELDDRFAALGAIIVVPYRTSYVVGDKYNAEITADVRGALRSLYAEFCEWTSCRTIRICVDDEDLTREMGEILNCTLASA